MKRHKIIGLCGAKGVGKDYFYHTVRDKYPNANIRKIAFADPIKQAVSNIFNLHGDEQYDMFKRSHITAQHHNVDWPSLVRDVTQIDGRHVVREIGMLMKSYDPHQFTTRLIKAIDYDAIWCVTDVRFEDEISAIKTFGGAIVKIKRAGIDYDGHITETEFADDRCDHVINNTTNNIEQYQTDVVDVFNDIVAYKNWSI